MSTITIRQLREVLDPSPRTRRSRPEDPSDQRIPANSMPAVSHNTDVRTVQNLLNRLPDGWNSPQSPDEAVIQKRGRRKSIVWSPDLDSAKQHNLLSLSSRDRTPIKTSPKPNVKLRDTVRKRLSLIDIHQPEFVAVGNKKTSLPSQVALNVTSVSTEESNVDLADGLRGLTHEQLVQLILELVHAQENGMLHQNEKFHNVILKKIALADIKQLIEKLDILRCNICATFKLFPNFNDSIHDSTFIHLHAFQEVLFHQGKILQESQQWILLIRYVLEACRIIKLLPSWQNHGPHNIIMQKCFHILLQFSIEAIEKGNFQKSILETCIESFKTMIEKCEDFQICLQMAQKVKDKL